MSLENVQAFYERIAHDQEFLAELQATQTQEEGRKILVEAGYDFTTEELEEYTSQALESTDAEDNVLEDLNEEQLATVFGGFGLFAGIIQPMYGVTWWPIKPWRPIKPWPPIMRPMYGVVFPDW